MGVPDRRASRTAQGVREVDHDVRHNLHGRRGLHTHRTVVRSLHRVWEGGEDPVAGVLDSKGLIKPLGSSEWQCTKLGSQVVEYVSRHTRRGRP